MKKIKVLIDFVRLSIPDKIVFYRLIIGKVYSNPKFSGVSLEKTTLTASVNALETSHLEAQSGAHLAVALMHKQESATDELFKQLALQVDSIAGGDEILILESGFGPSKQPTSKAKEDLSVDYTDKSGELLLRSLAVAGARAYCWQITYEEQPQKEEDWRQLSITTQTSYLATNLTPMTRCKIRVAAVTPDGIQDWSAPVAKIIV